MTYPSQPKGDMLPAMGMPFLYVFGTMVGPADLKCASGASQTNQWVPRNVEMMAKQKPLGLVTDNLLDSCAVSPLVKASSSSPLQCTSTSGITTPCLGLKPPSSCFTHNRQPPAPPLPLPPSLLLFPLLSPSNALIISLAKSLISFCLPPCCRTKMSCTASNDEVLAELSKVWDTLGEAVRREWVIQSSAVLDGGMIEEKDRFDEENESDFLAPPEKAVGGDHKRKHIAIYSDNYNSPRGYAEVVSAMQFASSSGSEIEMMDRRGAGRGNRSSPDAAQSSSSEAGVGGGGGGAWGNGPQHLGSRRPPVSSKAGEGGSKGADGGGGEGSAMAGKWKRGKGGCGKSGDGEGEGPGSGEAQGGRSNGSLQDAGEGSGEGNTQRKSKQQRRDKDEGIDKGAAAVGRGRGLSDFSHMQMLQQPQHRGGAGIGEMSPLQMLQQQHLWREQMGIQMHLLKRQHELQQQALQQSHYPHALVMMPAPPPPLPPSSTAPLLSQAHTHTHKHTRTHTHLSLSVSLLLLLLAPIISQTLLSQSLASRFFATPRQ